MIRLSPLAWTRLGFVVGCLLLVVGIGIAAGVAVALMAAGGLLAGSCLLLVDVAPKGAGR